MVISQNIPALNAQLNMSRANRALAEATKRLSSGYKINSAKDDPAGLAIANKLSLQLAGIGKATDNASNGVALVQTAEGALSEVHNMLQRMRELAVQAATDTLTAADRDTIMVEINQLVDEIQSTSTRTEYNGIKVLNGEGSRVTESHESGIAAIDDSISTILYVSEDVPPGRMEYTIDKVGMPATLNVGTVPATPNGDPVAISGSLMINGIVVEIETGDTFGSAMEKINEAMTYAGISREGTTKSWLVSKVAGSMQEVSIVCGDPNAVNFLNQFGLKTGTANGTDAVISAISLYDNGGGGAIATSPSGLVASAEGNQVTIKGMNGEEVKFNIQATMVYPAQGVNGVADGDNAVGAYASAKQMVFEFKDYGPIKIQVGGSYNNNVSVYIPKLSAETLGLVEYKGGQAYDLLNYCTRGSAELAIEQIDKAITMVSTSRSRLGAFVNRLDSTVRALDVANENTESSRSRIQDTDIAKEMTAYAQMNVMYQAGIAILTQANQRPSQVLQMLN